VLSLAVLLADPALELHLLVPGAASALTAEAVWVHNTELPDPSPYVRAGELVLTNGLWLDSTDPAEFVANARAALEEEIFGKRVLITDREQWPVAEVVAGYRSQSDAEFSFRQLKDRRLVSFSPMHHWTEHNIRVHLFTCVLALQLAHLMRRMARQAGLHHSVPELLTTLAGIQESVLIYPSTGGRPKARRMLTETSHEQDELATIFGLDRWAPRT
jgi:hypothetical protein